MNKKDVSSDERKPKKINWSAFGKTIDLIIVLGMGTLAYTAVTQPSTIMRTLGVVTAVQTARIIHGRWF